MAAALARASFAGAAAARLSLAEMMEVRGVRVAPEASVVAGVPGCIHGLRGRLGRKPVSCNRRFCCLPSITARLLLSVGY